MKKVGRPHRAAPAGGREVVWEDDQLQLYWRNLLPRKWADFVLFVRDKNRRKRSHFLLWNGDRWCDNLEHERAMRDWPQEMAAVTAFLEANRERFIKFRR